MTKKDYELIADAIKQRRQEYTDYQTSLYPTATEQEGEQYFVLTNKIAAIDDIIWCLGRALEQDNPRFDRNRFELACGRRGGNG